MLAVLDLVSAVALRRRERSAAEASAVDRPGLSPSSRCCSCSRSPRISVVIGGTPPPEPAVHPDGCHREGGSSGLVHPRGVLQAAAPCQVPGQKQRQWWLGTKWEPRALASAHCRSVLRTYTRLHLRKYGNDLVAGMWVHSWGSRGRRFKSGRPDWSEPYFELRNRTVND